MFILCSVLIWSWDKICFYFQSFCVVQGDIFNSTLMALVFIEFFPTKPSWKLLKSRAISLLNTRKSCTVPFATHTTVQHLLFFTSSTHAFTVFVDKISAAYKLVCMFKKNIDKIVDYLLQTNIYHMKVVLLGFFEFVPFWSSCVGCMRLRCFTSPLCGIASCFFSRVLFAKKMRL